MPLFTNKRKPSENALAHGPKPPKISKRMDRRFIDVAANNLATDEYLTVRIHEHTLPIRDKNTCKVMIICPHGGDGVFQARISPGDVAQFQKFKSTWLGIKPEDTSKDGHAIFLTMNARTGGYELYDPKGSIETSLPFEARGLLKAVHRGLLRALIAPEVQHPSNPFSVSFQTQARGIQDVERSECHVLQTQIANSPLLSPEIKKGLISYLRDTGFCVTWSMFQLVDNVNNSQLLFSFFAKAYIYNDERAKSVICEAARAAWFENFKIDVGLTDQKIATDLCNACTLPLFTRLLAATFVSLQEREYSLENISEWWPTTSVYEPPVPQLQNFMNVLWKFAIPSQDRVVDTQRYGDFPFEKWALNKYAARNPFPFPNAEEDSREFAKVCVFSVDTREPVYGQIDLK